MNRGPKTVVLLEAQSADETFSQPVDVRGYTHMVLYMIANGVVSGGAVTFLEGLIDPATEQLFGGTWATIGTAVTAPTTGLMTATHLTVGTYSHLQARISTAIAGGGTVTVVLVTTD